jgi:hypothetical protein
MVAIAALALAAPAAAQQPSDKLDRGHGMFFNRPGGTLDAALADTATCRAIAEGAQSQITGIGVLTGGLGGVLGGAIAGGRLKRVNVENCMLIRGWRLFAMTREEGAAWKALGEPQRQSLLAAMTGAETPERGSLLRVWRNDYAEPVLWQKN